MIASHITPTARQELAKQLRTKEKAVANGMYTHEPTSLKAAIAGYQRLSSVLGAATGTGIVEDLGNATTGDSRNVVRFVRLEDGTQAVAKVVGSVSEHGEGEWLQRANSLGLPTVPLIGHGVIDVNVEGKRHITQWVVTRRIDGTTLQKSLPAERTSAVVESVMRDLVPLATRFHEGFAGSGFRVRKARTWEDRMMAHLQWTNAAVKEAGLRLPDNWASGLRLLSSAPNPTQLHGDPAPVNILKDTFGRYLLFDPPGAIIGRPEADFGQMVAQVGNISFAKKAIEVVGELRPDLDLSFVAASAGFTFQQWAGYAAKAHSNPDVGPNLNPLDQAEEMLALAAELSQPCCELAERARGFVADQGPEIGL